MSKRAEEAALKAFPKYYAKIELPDSSTIECERDEREREIFIQSYEQAEKDTIERACKWLFSHLPILVDYCDEDIHENADRSELIKLFRTQMEEE